MNCLHIDPNTLTRKIDIKSRDYNYTCLDLLKSYEIPIHIYYSYLLSIEEFKFKNIWNIIVRRWTKMKRDLNENIDFLESDYNKNEYHQIHKKLNDSEYNDLLTDFIDGSHMKSLFVCNIIQGCIVPK